MLKIFHQYTVAVTGPDGHYNVRNNRFVSEDDNEAKQAAINRASAIINSFEYEKIRHMNTFDVVIDYCKTEIIGEKYSMKRGDII